MGSLLQAVHGSGLAPILEYTGAQLADFSEPNEFEVPNHALARRITLTTTLLKADVLISLPKLKTHGQMTLTGALKNQFGLVPGALKGQWHFRLQQPEWLAWLILDVNRVARPALAIMDAIVAMEGEGPSGGKPRLVGALLASPDLAALDTLACHLIGLDPMRVPLLAAAKAQAWGKTALQQIQLAGHDWQQLHVPDFEKVPALADLLQVVPLPKTVLRWIRRQWTARPRIMDGRCTQCGSCEQGCPVSPPAIHPRIESGQRVDDARCIRCYCCHEFCPAQAIKLQQPWLARQLPLNAIADRVGKLLGALTSHMQHGRAATKCKS
jgi:ferredoxin